MSQLTRIGALGLCLASVGLAQEVVQMGLPIRPAQLTPEAAPNQYIVKFRPGTPRNARAMAALGVGASIRYNYQNLDMIAVTVPNASAAESLRRHGQVLEVVPDRYVTHHAKPVPPPPPPPPPITFDTKQLLSYEVQRVGLPATGSDGTGIGIAVLDTGIDFAHPDLLPAANTGSSAYNAVTDSPGACQDDGGHGTHVAGLIAARNNDKGIVGVAPNATLYCVKALIGGDLTTPTPESVVVAALDWVVAHRTTVSPPIRVVNMSLGRPLASGESMDSTPMLPAIRALYNAGVVVVVSAGNDPAVEVSQVVPAGYAEVFAVAGTQATNGVKACTTSLPYVPVDAAYIQTTDGAFVAGRGVTISAPAEERTDLVNITLLGCVGLAYGTLSTTLSTGSVSRKLVPSLLEARGTSFSAPLVAGVVARVMQKGLVSATGNAAEVEGIRSWIRTNADRKGVAPLDHPWGTGVGYTFDGEREGIAQAPK